ncbi:hypothetical protein BZZ01_24460 [Nostocales cyanobacterium HT-58-2]|nr:hypothetical protein BZZ01_24460 [Nostocales cyanobacterium HT-58-2]
MKRWIVLVAFTLSFLLTIFISPNYGVNTDKQVDICRYNVIKPKSTEEMVENFADMTIESVENFADLHVQQVPNSLDGCDN